VSIYISAFATAPSLEKIKNSQKYLPVKIIVNEGSIRLVGHFLLTGWPRKTPVNMS